MGNTTSAEAISTQYNDTLNKTITDIASSVTNSVTNMGTAGQIMNITNNGTIDCGSGFKMSQTLTGAMKVFNQFKETDNIQLLATIKNALSADNSQVAKSASDILGGVDSSTKSLAVSNITNRVENIMETNITSTTLNESINAVTLNQDMTLINNGTIKGAVCIMSQDMVLDMQTSSLADKIMDAIVKDEAINTIVSSNKQEVVATALSPDLLKGLGILCAICCACTCLVGVGAMAGGPAGGGAGCMCLLLIIGIALLVYFLVPTSAYTTTTSSNMRIMNYNHRAQPLQYLQAFR